MTTKLTELIAFIESKHEDERLVEIVRYYPALKAAALAGAELAKAVETSEEDGPCHPDCTGCKGLRAYYAQVGE
mgnify:CR=1 FL=1